MPVRRPSQTDRREIAFDDKMRLLDLSTMNLVPPDVGICDEPIRLYPLNEQWASLIMGMVSWLATIAPWRDAEDELYIGIQEVRRFMIGCSPCEALAGCLTGLDPGSDLYQALIDWLTENQNQVLPSPDPESPKIPQVNDNLNTGGCDYDIIYGFALQMVQFLNRSVEDLLEVIEADMKVVQLIAEVVNVVPALSQFADWVLFVQESVVLNYLQNYDQELEQQIACDIFCLMTDPNNDCAITWDDLYDYFSLQLAYQLSDGTLLNWINFCTQGEWDGDEFVYLMMMTVVAVLAAGGSWSGITLPWIEKTIGSWFNDPDPDWQTLCTDCVWEYTWDWATQGQGGWVIDSLFIAEYQGVFVPGVGWQETAQDNSDNPEEGHDWSKSLCISYTLPVATTINYIQTTYDFVNSGHWDGTGNTQAVYGYGQSPTTHYIEYSAETDTTGTDKHGGFLGIQAQPAQKIRIRLVSGRWWQDSNPGGQATLKSIIIRGRGDNPFL